MKYTKSLLGCVRNTCVGRGRRVMTLLRRLSFASLVFAFQPQIDSITFYLCQVDARPQWAVAGATYIHLLWDLGVNKGTKVD